MQCTLTGNKVTSIESLATEELQCRIGYGVEGAAYPDLFGLILGTAL
jgi:hypothetical protein